MYTIYKITSPSGRCYVGMTKLKLSDRWDAHCTRAFRAGRKHHPFCCAIRKYGKAAFIKEVLETTEDLDAAKAAEIRWIAELRSAERPYGYNLSAGGDYDSEAGKEGMRKRMQDPDFNAAYRANLRAAMAKRTPDMFTPLVEGGKRWRETNPVQNYKNGRRAVRIATAAQNRPWTGIPGAGKRMRGTWGRLWIPSEKVRWARHAYFTKRHVKNKWASLDEEGRKTLLRQISEGQKAGYRKHPERKAKNFEQMKQARANVDRKKQGAAASKGLKNYWAELKKDPIAYTQALETRRATFKTNRDLRHRERGPEEPFHD